MNDFYRNHFLNWLEQEEANTTNTPAVENARPVTSQTDIVFENNELKLIVEKGVHKRQKNFRLQDHLFYFKIVQKTSSSRMPLLLDILDFLHDAIVHVLDSIKTFYEKGNKMIVHFLDLIKKHGRRAYGVDEYECLTTVLKKFLNFRILDVIDTDRRPKFSKIRQYLTSPFLDDGPYQ